jgi:bacterioferritin-associated ferredoxin
MAQTLLVIALFITALAYLGRLIYKQLQAKSACATGCGKCSVIDFKKIETDMLKKGVQKP